MKRVMFLALVGTLVASAASAQAPQGAGGGRGAAPEPPKNLQVLPKDTTTPQVVAIMQAFAAGMGVTCGYCHDWKGPGNPANDMASDMKPEKDKARAMMRLANDLNQKLPMAVSKAANETTRVQCVTCHRGVPIPKQLVDIVVDTGNAKGAAAAIAEYKELRTKFYGSQAYDFTDASLFNATQRATQANKPDDALAYGQANLDLFPMSARTYQAMSQAYQRKMDTANAVKMMEKAVELDPMNQGFQNQLNQLKNPGQGRGGRGQ